MPSTPIKVRATKHPVFREGVRRLIVDGKDRAQIYPGDVVMVPASRYYLKRIEMGDLEHVKDTKDTKDASEPRTGRKE